jgi:hypothetical protein
MAPEERSDLEYQPPRVTDLGTLADLTAGAGHNARDVAGSDGSGKT